MDIIEDSGTDRDSNGGAVLSVFETSEMKMNCGGGPRTPDQQADYEAIVILLNALVCEPCLSVALHFLGTA